MNRSFRQKTFLVIFIFLMALISFALLPPEVVSATEPTSAETVFVQEQEEGEEEEPLIFTPALAGVSTFGETRGPASSFAAYLADATGLPVETFVPTDYGVTLSGLGNGRYDIVYLPAPFYVKARAETDVTPGLAVSVNGDTTQTGLIVVAADSDIDELADLQGQRVGAANLDNAASWTLPAAALMDAGVNPFRDINAQFTGSDAESLIAVLNGDLDAAFVLDSSLQDEQLLQADPDAADNFTVLAEFTDAPIGVIVYGPHLDAATQEAVTAALTAPELAQATTDDGDSLLAALGWDALVPADDADFTHVYTAAASLGMIPAIE